MICAPHFGIHEVMGMGLGFAVITDPSAGCPPVTVCNYWETEPSPMLVLGCGTVCQQTLLTFTVPPRT